MVEIGGQALAPIFRRHLVDGVAVVSGRVVDEDRDGPDRVARAPDGRLKGGDVAHVAVLEMHALAQFLRQSLAGLGIVVEDGDLAALGMERTRDALPDAAGAAGDENGLVLQGAVDGLGHGTLVCRRSSERRNTCCTAQLSAPSSLTRSIWSSARK